MGSINGSVDLRRDGDVAVITIDNPPVNALRHDVRVGVADALARARGDAGVAAAVIACAGRTFVAGADITEFGKPPRAPSLRDLIDELEAMPKPVVAALFGTALGGGLELALACHFRVAAADARVGLPEIKLGLIPGAGGTQRLPRLTGPERALAIIVGGEPVPAAEARRDGVIDAIVDGDLVAGAVEFARRAAGERRKLALVRDRDDRLAPTRADPSGFDAAAASLTRRAKGQRAPAAAVEAVRDSFARPFDEGIAREREAFQRLLEGDQSKALRHVFFAEREAAKVADMPAAIAPARIARAAVIGAGTMGGGIAMCFANAGLPVTVIETGKDALDKGLARVAENYRATAARGGLAADEAERRLARIAGRTDLAAVAEADIVVEAVFEDMKLKLDVFGELDRLARPGALLATNTSTLDVDAIARATQRPADVLGMHFFSPANVMRLLEIVRGAATSFSALATAVAAGRTLRKVPVVVGVCDGFVGNRMLARRTHETERLLLEGALPHEVDAALLGFGFPMGPCAMADLAGLDVGWRIRQARGARSEIADALHEAGRMGQKNGRGYFRYEPGSRAPLPDPEVERMIVAASARLGIKRRAIPAEEIEERLIFPMINEGARILDERIAARPGDIDVIWVYGYGWPGWRGGPMFHADRVGLARVRDRLAEFAARGGDRSLEPATLLARLAAEGRGFGSLAPTKGPS